MNSDYSKNHLLFSVSRCCVLLILDSGCSNAESVVEIEYKIGFGQNPSVVILTMKMTSPTKTDCIFVIYGVDLGGRDHKKMGCGESQIHIQTL